ncbi:hypothetical protein ACVXG8_04485 [Escherichia coli]
MPISSCRFTLMLAPNCSATGASVWVLIRRANSEMASWLEQHEETVGAAGWAGDVLAQQSV